MRMSCSGFTVFGFALDFPFFAGFADSPIGISPLDSVPVIRPGFILSNFSPFWVLNVNFPVPKLNVTCQRIDETNEQRSNPCLLKTSRPLGLVRLSPK